MELNERGYDLVLVAPERREETLRRIGVIERYLRGEYRNGTAPAAELGLSSSQFSLLVHAWRRDRRPETLSGAKTSRARTTHLNPAVTALIRRIEREHPDDKIERVIRQVRAAAAEDEMVIPTSAASLRKQIATARLERTSLEPAGTGLAIDHCAIQLGVPVEGGAAMAVGSFLLDLDRRQVLGIALTDGNPGPGSAARAIVHALDTLGDRAATAAYEGVTTVTMRTDAPARWKPVKTALESAGFASQPYEPRRTPPGQTLTRILGMKIADFRLRPRSTTRAPEDRPMIDAKVDLEEAERTVRLRMPPVDQTASRLAELSQPRRDRLRLVMESLSSEGR